MIKSINAMRELKLPVRPSVETIAPKASEAKQEYILNGKSIKNRLYTTWALETTSETPESSCIEFPSRVTASETNPSTPVVNKMEPESISPAPIQIQPSTSLALVPSLQQQVEVTEETISPRDAVDPYPKKRTTCQICNKKFRTLMQLAQHTRVVHEKSADTRPHKCPLCPAKFKVSGTLVTHLR